MKKIAYLIIVCSVLGFICIGCDENSEPPEESIGIVGELISHSSCKSGEKTIIVADSLSCIEYVYDSVNKQLSLKHINAGFNCCPESLYVETSVIGNTITIQEFEQSSLCDCNCLYDLEIELSGLEKQQYHIEFIEPYIANQEELLFDIDLSQAFEGEFCVVRNQYPWGVGSASK